MVDFCMPSHIMSLRYFIPQAIIKKLLTNSYRDKIFEGENFGKLPNLPNFCPIKNWFLKIIL